jgi:hypothetical protein
VSDAYDVTTLDEATVVDTGPTLPVSNIYVTGNYNGLISHASTGSTHFIIATPSIIAYDISDPDVMNIIRDKKLVYNGFENIPASYTGSNLIMNGGFDFTITAPLLYEGTKEDL